MTSPDREKLSNREREILRDYDERYQAQRIVDPLAPEELIRHAEEQSSLGEFHGFTKGERDVSPMIRRCKACGAAETLGRPFIDGECDACLRARTPREERKGEKSTPLTLFGWEVGLEKLQSDARGLKTALGRYCEFFVSPTPGLLFPTPGLRKSPEFLMAWCVVAVFVFGGLIVLFASVPPMPPGVPSSGSSNYEQSSKYEQGYESRRDRDRQEAYGVLRDHGWSQTDAERGAETIEEMHTRDRQIRSGSYRKP